MLVISINIKISNKKRDVGPNLIVPAGVRTIDATGKLVIPGGVDANTFFEYYTSGTRTADDFFTGTKAAISGGTTTISNFIFYFIIKALLKKS